MVLVVIMYGKRIHMYLKHPLSKDQVLPCIETFIPAMDFDVTLTFQTNSLQISNIHTCSYCKRIISTHILHTERRD